MLLAIKISKSTEVFDIVILLSNKINCRSISCKTSKGEMYRDQTHIIRMKTFIKTKFKKSDDQTNIDNIE